MTYTDEDKMIIINRLNEGGSINAICNEYGVSRSTLYRWTHDGRESTSDSENVQVHSVRDWNILYRRMEKLENIIAILKTVNCTIHSPLKEKLTELELLYGQYDVHTLCEALEVSRGTFYNHILRNKRGDAWFEKRREEYRVLIRDVFNEKRTVHNLSQPLSKMHGSCVVLSMVSCSTVIAEPNIPLIGSSKCCMSMR